MSSTILSKLTLIGKVLGFRHFIKSFHFIENLSLNDFSLNTYIHFVVMSKIPLLQPGTSVEISKNIKTLSVEITKVRDPNSPYYLKLSVVGCFKSGKYNLLFILFIDNVMRACLNTSFPFSSIKWLQLFTSMEVTWKANLRARPRYFCEIAHEYSESEEHFGK